MGMSKRNVPISERIVERAADKLNEDPMTLPALYGKIDPDSLDRLIENMENGQVTFTYAGCTVTVTSEEEIVLKKQANPTNSLVSPSVLN